MSLKQTDIFRQLCATFPMVTIRKWEAMVIAWNANPKAPNPYAESKNGVYAFQSLGCAVLFVLTRYLFIRIDSPRCPS